VIAPGEAGQHVALVEAAPVRVRTRDPDGALEFWARDAGPLGLRVAMVEHVCREVKP